MTTEYEWNGLRVRRDEQGSWETAYSWGWTLLSDDHSWGSAIAAELDRLYPLPRTVTLDNGGVWRQIKGGWASGDADGPWVGRTHRLAAALDTLDRLQNGGDR